MDIIDIEAYFPILCGELENLISCVCVLSFSLCFYIVISSFTINKKKVGKYSIVCNIHDDILISTRRPRKLKANLENKSKFFL